MKFQNHLAKSRNLHFTSLPWAINCSLLKNCRFPIEARCRDFRPFLVQILHSGEDGWTQGKSHAPHPKWKWLRHHSKWKETCAWSDSGKVFPWISLDQNLVSSTIWNLNVCLTLDVSQAYHQNPGDGRKHHFYVHPSFGRDFPCDYRWSEIFIHTRMTSWT